MKKWFSVVLALGIVLALAVCPKELVDPEDIDTISMNHYATQDDCDNDRKSESAVITDTAQLAELCAFINSLARSENTGRPNEFPRYEINITFSNGDTSRLSFGQYNVVAGELLGCGNHIASRHTDCYRDVSAIMDGMRE